MAQSKRKNSVSEKVTKKMGRGWLFVIIAALAFSLSGCEKVIGFITPKEEVAETIEEEPTVIKSGDETPEVEVLDAKNDTETVEAATSKPEQEQATDEVQTSEGGINVTLNGEISTIENVKMMLRGKTGSLSYVMDGKRIVSNLVLDEKDSRIDKDGFGHLVIKSFTPDGKLKGRFIGEMDVAECGYLYEGRFVNVNGGSTTFFLAEV